MRMSPGRFNGMLRNMGQAVRWRPAYNCPCRDSVSGQGRMGCSQCKGTGWFWDEARDAWTGLADLKAAREWAAFGRWESRDVVLTVPSDSPLYAAGENDRVQMVQSSLPYSSVLTRGDGDAVDLNATVARVFWLTPDTETLVEGAIPPVDADGNLLWDGLDPAPDPGVQYTVTGRAPPEYFVYQDLPQDRAHFGGLPLPRRMVLRRFDLFGRAHG